MKLTHLSAFFATALLLPVNSAMAFEKCEGLDEKKIEKCEKKETKRIDKLRKTTTPFVPSKLGPDFASLDSENPFDMDSFYLGMSDTGIEPIDELLNEVAKIQAAVKMAKYVGYLNKNGEGDKAQKYAKPTLDALMELQNAQDGLMEKVQGLQSDPAALVSSPTQIPKAVSSLTSILGQIPQVFADIPGAISAVKPLASGAAAGAIEGAVPDMPAVPSVP